MFLSSLVVTAAVPITDVISSGLSFIFVTRNVAARSRVHGLATVLGIGADAAISSIMVMLNLQKMLIVMLELFIGLKVTDKLYLLWLGYKIFRELAQPTDSFTSDTAGNHSLLKTFRDELYTQLSNPKTVLVLVSIPIVLLPVRIPAMLYYTVLLMSFLTDVNWYSLMMLMLSADCPWRAYLRLKRRVDIATATVLGALDLRLITISLTR